MHTRRQNCEEKSGSDYHKSQDSVAAFGEREGERLGKRRWRISGVRGAGKVLIPGLGGGYWVSTL